MVKRFIVPLIVLALFHGSVRAETPEEETAKLEASIRKLEREIEYLESEYARLKKELDVRQASIAKLISEKRMTPTDGNDAKNDKPDKAIWRWTIDASSMARNTTIISGGVPTTISTPYDDRLRAYGNFINKSKAPYQYKMKFIVYQKAGYTVKNPPVLGTHTYTTPPLKPSQGVTFSEIVYVSTIQGGWNTRIVDIEPIPVKE